MQNPSFAEAIAALNMQETPIALIVIALTAVVIICISKEKSIMGLILLTLLFMGPFVLESYSNVFSSDHAFTVLSYEVLLVNTAFLIFLGILFAPLVKLIFTKANQIIKDVYNVNYL